VLYVLDIFLFVIILFFEVLKMMCFFLFNISMVTLIFINVHTIDVQIITHDTMLTW